MTMEKITKYFEDFGRLVREVEVTTTAGSRRSFAEGVQLFQEKVGATHRDGGKIIFIGNGGSAGIASHMSADYTKNGGFRALTFSDPALLTCLSNDLGYENVFSTPVKTFAQRGDVMVAISSSGQSKNILNAVHVAQDVCCEVVTLSGFSMNNPLRSLGSCNFYVPSQTYGFVEIAHLCICHVVLDTYSGGVGAANG
jgi:D-sedoheptulose 7-phosphate isomerase